MVGLPAEQYNTHSLHIGPATSATHAGVPHSTIKRLGAGEARRTAGTSGPRQPPDVPFWLKTQGDPHLQPLHANFLLYSVLSHAHFCSIVLSVRAVLRWVFPTPLKKGGGVSLGARKATVPQNLLIWLPATLFTIHAHYMQHPCHLSTVSHATVCRVGLAFFGGSLGGALRAVLTGPSSYASAWDGYA